MKRLDLSKFDNITLPRDWTHSLHLSGGEWVRVDITELINALRDAYAMLDEAANMAYAEGKLQRIRAEVEAWRDAALKRGVGDTYHYQRVLDLLDGKTG